MFKILKLIKMGNTCGIRYRRLYSSELVLNNPIYNNIQNEAVMIFKNKKYVYTNDNSTMNDTNGSLTPQGTIPDSENNINTFKNEQQKIQ